MGESVIYSLEVNKKGVYNSFEYETRSKAEQAYKFICDKFCDSRIIDRISVNSDKDIVQLTIRELITGSVMNTMAPLLPEQMFSKDVYDEILTVASEYHKKKHK
ncbi:hypothetical protein J9303_00410 [Bacillaceae bacterium Marseille-Q3522]|nr:hypothetical protein [Bacillaceae bacterium Marseille-Q3522]